MSLISGNPPVNMGIPECKLKEHFDAKAVTSELMAAPLPPAKVTKTSLDCSQGVQTTCHPPLPLQPVFKTRANPFRKQVLWKYPFLVNKDSLYDKKDRIFRDPEEPLSTYKRDYGCDSGDIELVRSTGQAPVPDLSPKRYPTLDYMPRNRVNISREMGVFYSLPGGRWSLNAREKARAAEPLKPAIRLALPKWESEYQANINGLANYMCKMKVLTKKIVRVYRIPTLPE